MQDILDVTKRQDVDESIIRWTYHPYFPHNTLSINNSDEIRICVNNQDILTLPSQSYLYIKGKFENKDNGHFVKNGLAFLFDEIRYEIASKEVDSVRNPGIASLMKYVCSPNTKKRFSNACIDTDENLKKISENGEFSGCIPLDMLLGVFEDFDKVLVNVKQELILKIARNSLNAIFTTATVPTGDGAVDPIPKVAIDEIQWFIPHILASDSEKYEIQKTIAAARNLYVSFRSYELHMMPAYPTSTTKHTWAVKTTNQLEKPRYVIFGFQTNRDNAARKRCDGFDHCNLKNIKVFLNSEYYPYSDLNLKFDKNDVAKAYEMFVRFQHSYYNNNIILDPLIDRDEFVKDFPLLVIDCSKQNESIKEGIVDMKIEIETDSNVAAGTIAYCLIIHRKQFEYNPMTNEVSKM